MVTRGKGRDSLASTQYSLANPGDLVRVEYSCWASTLACCARSWIGDARIIGYLIVRKAISSPLFALVLNDSQRIQKEQNRGASVTALF